MRAFPVEAIISVTNRCDARCQMCNIWRMERNELLSPSDYMNLPSGLENVNITGGEALLRPDIIEVVHSIYEASGRPRVILATNGFRPEKTIRQIDAIRAFVPDLGVAVSLDGLERLHDEVRGVPKAFSRAVQTLRDLSELGVRDLRIGFTATASNIGELPAVLRLAGELGVEFTATVAQESDTYFGVTGLEPIPLTDVRKFFGHLIDCQLSSFTVKSWFRAYFAHGVIRFAQTGQRMGTCSAATDFFYLSPRGDVFPCLTLNKPLGNLRSARFEEIWQGHAASSVREVVAGCQACWMVCTARSELKKAPVRAVGWVLKEQVRRAFKSRRLPADASSIP